MVRIRQFLMPYSAALIALLALSGCTTSSLFSKLMHKQKFVKATAANPAVRCLCLWEPSEGVGVDNKPARGVSGQIFFFTRSDAASVVVDGDVRIFVFDDQGSADDQTQPLHQFDFVAGTWQAHLTSTQFGPAYQLFVPYSRKGRHQAELALRVRLTPPNGLPLYSEMAKVSLPGYERAKDKSGSDPYEPEGLPAGNVAEDNFTRVDRITPEKIGETYLKVLAERREFVDSTDFTVAETSANSRSNRPARREFARSDKETGGEFNVVDEPDNASESAIRRRQRQVPLKVDETIWEDED